MANARAAKAEATGTPGTFEYDGDSYTVEPASTWDLDALDAFEAGNISSCVRTILGAEQWKTFRAKRRTVADLRAVFTEIDRVAGFEGN